MDPYLLWKTDQPAARITASGQDIETGGLASLVQPQEIEKITALDRKENPVQRGDMVEFLD
jgi:hypothetical protein